MAVRSATPAEMPVSPLIGSSAEAYRWIVSREKQLPLRSAWVEVSLGRLEQNFRLIRNALPDGVRILSVIKDEAYGHGSLRVAEVAGRCGVAFFGLSTVEEAMALRNGGNRSRLLLLGDRHESELAWCVAHDLTCCLSERHSAERLAELAAKAGKRVPVHLKINTGMNRYGVRWDRASELAAFIAGKPSLLLEGAMTHFAQSEDGDRSFARVQLQRFQTAIAEMAALGISLKLRHICNSGGFLYLPEAHMDLVRLGLLPLGVYPGDEECSRVAGLEPVMTVKARIASIQVLQPGDCVGYGMSYRADSTRRIAVLPIGYGDGFPRVTNEGFALIYGRRVPVVGRTSMDAITVDITAIPEARLGDEAVILGRQGPEHITANELAALKRSIPYDVFTGWHPRLPRLYSAH